MIIPEPVKGAELAELGVTDAGIWHGVVRRATLGGACNNGSLGDTESFRSDVINASGYTALTIIFRRSTGGCNVRIFLPRPDDIFAASPPFQTNLGNFSTNTRLLYGAGGSFGTGDLFPWFRVQFIGLPGGCTGLRVDLLLGNR